MSMKIRKVLEILERNQSSQAPTPSSEAADYDPDIVFKVKKNMAKEWHRQSDLEFRTIIVQQSLQNLFHTKDVPDLDVQCVRACFEQLRNMEFAIFLTANNRGEYYHYGCALSTILYWELQWEKDMFNESSSMTEDMLSKSTNSGSLSLINIDQKEHWEADRYTKVLARVQYKLLKRFQINISKYLIPLLSHETELKNIELYSDFPINFGCKEQVLHQKHGDHEIFILEAKTDKEMLIENCPKKNGHKNMIPVKDFTIKQLPEELHNEELFKFIGLLIDVTVAIEVYTKSPNRPKLWPHSKSIYPFSEAQIANQARCGTGRICNVTQHSSTKHHFSKFRFCPCEKCKASTSPSNEWGEILILTAAHVVFDNSEAMSTRCKFFYDSKDSKVITLDGISVVEIDIERDWCRFKCASCDMQLVQKLDKLLFSFFISWYKIYHRYKSVGDKHRLTIIVSHPHGETKQVSIGEWTKMCDVGVPFHTQYFYQTSTCPGSSGAFVFFLGVSGTNMHWFDQHIHSGVIRDPKNKDCSINVCGVGWENDYSVYRRKSFNQHYSIINNVWNTKTFTFLNNIKLKN